MQFHQRPVPATNEGSPLLDIIQKLHVVIGGGFQNGPWIAGGSVLGLLKGAGNIPPNYAWGDIDIFLPIDSDEEAVAQALSDFGAKNATPCSIAPILRTLAQQASDDKDPDRLGYKVFTYMHSGWSHPVSIQLITFAKYRDLESLFESFDFSVAKFATDGHSIVGSAQSWDDFNGRILRAEKIDRKTLWRITKYCLAGFTPQPGLVQKSLQTAKKTHFNPATKKMVHDGNY